MAIRLTPSGPQSIDPDVAREQATRIKQRSRGSSSTSARVQAEFKAKQNREAAQKAAQEEAKRKATLKLIERQKLSRLQKERLDALAKLTRTKRARRQALRIKEQQVERDIVAVSRRQQIKPKTREQRVQELMSENRKRGLLPNRTSATRVIDNRIVREKKEGKITTGEVQPRPVPDSFIARKIQELNDLQKIKSTSSIRTKQKNLKNELTLLGVTIGTTIISGTAAFFALPSTLINLAKNPSQLKKVPSAIGEAGKRFGQVIRTSPTEALGLISGELLFLKGTGGVFKAVGTVGGKTANKLNPFLKRVKGGELTIKTTKGKTILTTGQTVKKLSEPLRVQAELAGKKVTAVSAQADRLVSLIKTKRVVRKPIPGEAEFSTQIKKLLKKFDDGNINKQELIRLQKKVPVLERSFFADPRGRFRPSRLGIQPQKDASLLDILSGDFTFRTPKPQILVFENVKVAKFPKALVDIEKALKSGKSLTSTQAKRLLDWQSKKTGKFKPIGALSKEPEITLSPGEIIKKVKKRGTALINGKRVSIVEVKVSKPTASTKKLLSKSRRGKITPKELKILRKKLKKETGFNNVIGRRTITRRPRARLPKRVPTRIRGRRITKRPPRRPTKRTQRRPPGRSTTKRPPKRPPRRPPKRPPRRPPKRPPRRPPKRPPRRPPRIPPVVPPPIIPPRGVPSKVRKKKPLKKPVQVFDVFGKSRGKFVKLNKIPLTKNDALSKGAFAIDRTTARTFKIAPKGKTKTPGSLFKSERNYFSRQGFKLREVRIKKGRKFKLKQKYIEKTKFAIDTKSEKSGLSVAALLQRRRVMLSNLKKARRVRMKNLKGGKRK